MRYKVLVAGDNLKSLIILRKSLELFTREFTVYNTHSLEKLEIIDSQDIPDIIILNFDDTLGEGIKAIKMIRSSVLIKNVPILLATKFLSSEVQKAIRAGANDFIKTPIERIELIVRIKYLTERNRLYLENIRQSSELQTLSLVADMSESSVIIINLKGELEWANKAFEKLYEYPLIEFKNKYGNKLHSISPKFSEAFKKCKKNRSWEIYENLWVTRSNAKKWIHTSLTPLISEDGEIKNYIAVETDITELKQTREKLLYQNQDLKDLKVNLNQINKKLEEQEKEVNRQRKLAEEKKKLADNLLLNIFPFEIAEQLKLKGYAIPKHYRLASIMFTDFVNFSKLSEQLTNYILIKELSMYFENFDLITKAHNIEKIKTIGDSYMCAGGLPVRNRSNPIDTVLAALEIQKFVTETNIIKQRHNQPKWEIRTGIHTGEVIAGVIGKSKMAYDIWGDAVNTASRMETSGEVNMINISGTTYQHVCEYFHCSYRGEVEVRNMGQIDMYFVTGLKKEYSADKDGIIPNAGLKKIISELKKLDQ